MKFLVVEGNNRSTGSFPPSLPYGVSGFVVRGPGTLRALTKAAEMKGLENIVSLELHSCDAVHVSSLVHLLRPFVSLRLFSVDGTMSSSRLFKAFVIGMYPLLEVFNGEKVTSSLKEICKKIFNDVSAIQIEGLNNRMSKLQPVLLVDDIVKVPFREGDREDEEKGKRCVEILEKVVEKEDMGFIIDQHFRGVVGSFQGGGVCGEW